MVIRGIRFIFNLLVLGLIGEVFIRIYMRDLKNINSYGSLIDI